MAHLRRHSAPVAAALAALLLCATALAGCGSGGDGGDGGGGGGTPAAPGASEPAAEGDGGTTAGPAFTVPGSVALSAFHGDFAETGNGCSIDVSAVADGYVGASAQSDSRLKFQVSKGEASYNYDLPSDGTPIVAPLNMGSGSYSFRVMQNTSGNNYVELFATTADVSLASEQAPFLVPNMFVNYDESSAVVAKARELAQGAANQGDVVRNIYQWVVANISYDHDKAAELASVTGYVPDPDATLAAGTGICFDYASLGAAMLRSLGIPCQLITGYVAPDDIYHAWNMVYIDGEWVSVEISIQPNSWTRVDLTFAASGASSTIGDGTGYTDRYTY
ncbi:transglutaminase-like domain-containing protein [Adlercreutzia muris]|uniref:transglutaminase-like domain-containing protein n=1 Tax=Adlercreutzia muris TaxID=1796610 RepID=UPI001F5793CA|nr:transglutaminase-like domain-containing protein [Adlercreutzia muris]MCU7584820.1 transglutaminase-like domain-containing protein [Adlercreutzia muris]